MPLVNGNARFSLFENNLNTLNAIRHSIRVLEESAPRNIDYLRSEDFAAAARDHADRVCRMESVFEEIQRIAEHIMMG
jgi:hypothetical protein